MHKLEYARMLGGTVRILFVDDEADILELIEIALMTEDDLDLTFAPSGIEAIRHIEEEKFDIIMLDVMMPPPNGMEVLRYARSMADLNGSIIVMCTARTSPEAEQEMRALGANYILHKPFKPLGLATYLRGLV